MPPRPYNPPGSPKIEDSPEKIARSFIEAFNNRDTELSSPVWAPMAPYFKVTMFSTTLDGTSLAGFLEWAKFQAANSPDIRVNVGDSHMTLNEGGDIASVYMNTRITGGRWPGVAMPQMTLFEFHLYGSEWMCVKQIGINAAVESGIS